MRIEAFLRESPMFTVKRAARYFDRLAAEAFSADDLGFMEGLLLAAIFFEEPGQINPSRWRRPSRQRAAMSAMAFHRWRRRDWCSAGSTPPMPAAPCWR